MTRNNMVRPSEPSTRTASAATKRETQLKEVARKPFVPEHETDQWKALVRADAIKETKAFKIR